MPHSAKSCAHREAARQQHRRDDRAGAHRERVDDVVRRDDARAVIRLALVLQHGVERHGEQPAGHRHAHESPSTRRLPGIWTNVSRPASAAPARAAGAGADGGRTRRTPSRRRPRHEARAHLAVEQPLGQHRAEADTDGKERQHQRHHVLVGKQHVLGEHRQPRDDRRAEQPEPRERQDRQQQLGTARWCAAAPPRCRAPAAAAADRRRAPAAPAGSGATPPGRAPPPAMPTPPTTRAPWSNSTMLPPRIVPSRIDRRCRPRSARCPPRARRRGGAAAAART